MPADHVVDAKLKLLSEVIKDKHLESTFSTHKVVIMLEGTERNAFAKVDATLGTILIKVANQVVLDVPVSGLFHRQ